MVQAAFHESYFNHPCTVVTEEDVLQTDIKGKGTRAAFRRWFHSLFLLSIYDERCRVYFVSSHALRLERARHYRRYRGRIHPLSKFNNVWTIIIFIVTVINRTLYHYHIAFLFGKQSVYSLTIGMMCEAIMLIDIIINFKTGYTDEVARKVILGAKMGYIHYGSTKLFLHAGAAIPLQFILTLRYGFEDCLLCKVNGFVCVLKIIGLFGLCRLYDASSFLSRQKSSFFKMHVCSIFRIVVLASITLLQVLDLIETISLMIMIHFQNIHKESYLLTLNGKIRFYQKPVSFFICFEISRLCKFLVLYGYGLYRDDYYLDKMFALVCHIIGCSFFVWALKETYSIIHRQKYATDERIIFLERTQKWMKYKQVSDMISRRVTEYYSKNSILTQPRVVERTNNLYQCLPTILTKEIQLSCNLKFFRRISYFSEWPIDVVEDLVTLFVEEVFLVNDLVSHPSIHGDGLVIIRAGVLAVYDERERGHLIDGDYYGELSLVTDKEIRTSSVVAVTVTQVIFLSKEVFRKYMRGHPELFFQLRTILFQKFSVQNDSNLDTNVEKTY